MAIFLESRKLILTYSALSLLSIEASSAQDDECSKAEILYDSGETNFAATA